MCHLAKRKTDRQSQPGRLRIVAGNWRSRLLEIADVPGLRPTSARIRETLFNWLAPRIAGARCLDLCAGTGALGLEALSRGAAFCLFVEHAHAACRVIRKNIAALDLAGAARLQAYAKAQAKSRDLLGEGKIRVNKSGCLDRCEIGPVAVVYPDAVWYHYFDEADIDEIIESHLINGKPVERLRV